MSSLQTIRAAAAALFLALGVAAPSTARADPAPFLVGTWQSQAANNQYEMQVTWNEVLGRYEGTLIRQGLQSQQNGYVLGEVIWMAAPARSPGTLAVRYVQHYGGGGVSAVTQWIDDAIQSDPTRSAGGLRTAGTFFTRVASAGAAAGAAPAGQATGADLPPALRHDVDVAAQGKVDLGVFGIQLGQPLRLPPCPDGSPAMMGLRSGIGYSGVQTCSGDGVGTQARQLLESFGPPPPAAANLRRTPVALAAAACPDWVKAGGVCVLLVTTANGYTVGVTFADNDSLSLDEIGALLSKKYGAAPTALAPPFKTCTSPVTGLKMDTPSVKNERQWALPGVQVHFNPMGSNCVSGSISVELDTLHRMLATAGPPAEAPQPKM